MRLLISFSLIVFSLNLLGQPFNTQNQWEIYFKSKINDLDPIEGIWSNNEAAKLYINYTDLLYNASKPQVGYYAIYKVGSSFKAFFFGWEIQKSSEISLKNTALPDVYLMDIYYDKSFTTAKANALMTGSGLLEFNYEVPKAEFKRLCVENGTIWKESYRTTMEHQLIKIYPNGSDYKSAQRTSGSGFGISSNGIIVTNYHVIDGVKSIKVRGANSDFSKSYNAKILISDKNNDLALIQIDDYGFTSLGTIPYAIKTGLAGVGENVFVLGYPLRATMGDEIKLTNGIISSQTGFQGDITSYQISAPVQPGNSGGPLFDSQGNLIGIINAKHGGAENASYAVKTSYLRGLIELLPSPPKLQTVNSLTGKTLTQQVELVKKFVYIIETE